MKISSRIIAIFLSGLLLQACQGTTDSGLPANADKALLEELNQLYVPFEPEIGAAVPRSSEDDLVSASLPYPPFNPHNLKTIGPDDNTDRQRWLNAGIGGIKLNLIWSAWQPAPNLSLNSPRTFEYGGRVWMISAAKEKLIEWYSTRGIKVTAVLIGTPEWARPVNTARAKNVPLVDEKFIAPDNAEDYALFAGMLAKRFNGANGNGRIVNFVIQNEVNSLAWYNPGCGADGHPCVIDDRIRHYGDLFNRAYDRIVSEQPHAKVMHSFDHHFGEDFFDHTTFTSAKRFVDALDPITGDRQWRMSIHSYPPDLFSPQFGPFDYPKITFGNLGILAAYMRQRFPHKPHTWDIHLTENGVNSGPPSDVDAMWRQISVATRNVLGTPGIETFYYHRLADHPQEGNFTPGLFDRNGNPKPAWQRWSTNNLTNAQPPQLSDGYEDLPYIKLERSARADIGHWASTRQAPSGYVSEGHYWLLREPIADTVMLFECYDHDVQVSYISGDIGCSGFRNYGPVGYAYTGPGNGRAPLYTIRIGTADYIVTSNPDEVAGDTTLLGYVDTDKHRSQALPERDARFFDTGQGTAPTTAPSNNTATQASSGEASPGVWGSCTVDGSGACAFFNLRTSPGQTHSLSCSADTQNSVTAILRYGNNTNSTARRLALDSSGNTSIPLSIGDDSTWASVRIESTGLAVPACTVSSSGGLQIGATVNSGILNNGSFETELSDWQFCQQDELAVITNQAQHGSTAIEISDDNCVYQIVEIEPETEYTGTCYIRNLVSGTQSSLRLAIANSSYQTMVDSVLQSDSTEFQIQSDTLTAPENSKYAVITFSSAEPAIVDNCSLVEVSGQ